MLRARVTGVTGRAVRLESYEDVRAQGSHRRWGVVDDAVDEPREVFRLEWRAPGEELVEHDAERVEVRLVGQLLFLGLFGRHVPR